LIVSPLEAVRATQGGRMTPKPEVAEVIAIQRRVAEERGCGFWSMYRSMGGEGSLARWVEADLMLGDLIHPRSRGSDLLGEMLAEALMRGYDDADLGESTGRLRRGRPRGATPSRPPAGLDRETQPSDPNPWCRPEPEAETALGDLVPRTRGSSKERTRRFSSEVVRRGGRVSSLTQAERAEGGLAGRRERSRRERPHTSGSVH